MSYAYKEYKGCRESSYSFDKRWRAEEYTSAYELIKCRKYSRYEQLKDRAYDSYMIDGLCYGNYFGLEKISHLRLKYIKAIKFK